MNFNGYNGTIDNGFGNPLGGRSAFVGSSHGYISTRLDLASLAGQTVTFRWRAAKATGSYRLVLSRAADLSAPLAEVETQDTRHALSSPAPGSYYWGVLDANGQPLFPRARRLVLRSAGKDLQLPGHLKTWGD